MTLVKTCGGCKEEKPLALFSKDKNQKDGRHRRCKACMSEWGRLNYQAKAAKRKEQVRLWAAQNPEKVREYQRKSDEKNRARVSRTNRKQLLRAYGLTLADYDRMFCAQASGCAICHAGPPEGGNLDVDHDHQTGAVRGLLCKRCNMTLGKYEDNSRFFHAAADYLVAHLVPPETPLAQV